MSKKRFLELKLGKTFLTRITNLLVLRKIELSPHKIPWFFDRNWTHFVRKNEKGLFVISQASCCYPDVRLSLCWSWQSGILAADSKTGMIMAHAIETTARFTFKQCLSPLCSSLLIAWPCILQHDPTSLLRIQPVSYKCLTEGPSGFIFSFSRRQFINMAVSLAHV